VLWPCVRPSVRLVRGRGTARRQVVQKNQRRDVVVHAVSCYRHTAVALSVHPCGLLLQTHSSGVVSTSMRPIATDTQQWRGHYIHAAYCYRHAAVEWLVQQSSVTISTKCSLTRHGLDHFCNRVNLYYVIIGCNIDVFSTSVHHI